MANPFYGATGNPISQSRGTSGVIRTEFGLIDAGFTLVNAAISANTLAIALKAPLASPSFTAGASLASGAATNAYFEVAGNANTVGASSMIFGQDATSLGIVWNRANAAVAFATNSAERMRVSSTGNLLIGTTTDNGTDKLQVAGSARIGSGFGCNGKSAQSAVAVNAAATDAVTTQALVNQLRTALIANGIVV